ncbi:hypothetical protein EPO04_02400 [Patescibacteria group bacterium]|nr:MAG: hypothetical protein EPO04_02400 [Patescibacteria group bacterium]
MPREESYDFDLTSLLNQWGESILVYMVVLTIAGLVFLTVMGSFYVFSLLLGRKLCLDCGTRMRPDAHGFDLHSCPRCHGTWVPGNDGGDDSDPRDQAPSPQGGPESRRKPLTRV